MEKQLITAVARKNPQLDDAVINAHLRRVDALSATDVIQAQVNAAIEEAVAPLLVDIEREKGRAAMAERERGGLTIHSAKPWRDQWSDYSLNAAIDDTAPAAPGAQPKTHVGNTGDGWEGYDINAALDEAEGK